ncbi:molybdopterin-dependent oxidoreductase [Paenibacillus cremeus]|uniref:Molybdopterin-dependent oxidoreductase n=1 Tax=Paenibacillus cremeus TaxID=2163881 RepID=A0A559K0B2_9BACL|nr:molybdopterin-dependent oxidoreductase [Paenibacillus cremeus]TVY05536.1 molybdopterin-dependent oxidoreductase [Paenibacillus cremeus]
MKERKPWIEWLSGVAYGKKLKKLHSWNAWLLLFLTVTGILLFVPSVRELGEGRAWLKQAHIWLGVISIIVLVLYLPLLSKHWKQLRAKTSQRLNLGLVLFLLVGWIVTGIMLWQLRSLPPGWTNVALILHDLFTWVGAPYAVYHSISRSRWMKAARAKKASAAGAEVVEERTAAGRVIDMLQKAKVSRSAFLRMTVGALLLLCVGPSFYRWMKGVSDTGGTDLSLIRGEDGNHMDPPPVALPESNPPVGGGGKGQFRIYTVTDIPSFSSDNWKFAISGLVEKEQVWDWKQFLDLKRKVQVSDFHCVTGWSVYKNTWEGIPLSELLKLAQVKPQAKFVKFYSGDKVYTDCLSLEQAKMDDVMVAVMIDGKPIPQDLGGPVRLVVPQMYAYKSVKWLQAIELIDKEHIGYWELRGYDNDAWVPGSRRT